MMSESEIVLLAGKLAANAWTRIRNRDRGNELNRTLYENMIGTEMCELLMKIRSEAEQHEKHAVECQDKMQATDRRLKSASAILHDVLKTDTVAAECRDKIEKFLGLKKKQQKQLPVQKENVAENPAPLETQTV